MADISLESVCAFFEDHSESLLRRYIRRLEGGQGEHKVKEFNDPIWGTIALSAVEVAIVDSPLFQRLRSVRQLGVAHWVYPGAVHTRFEHTLGVIFQIQQLVNAINAFPKRPQNTTPIVEYRYTQLLRLCALMHDIGHPSFSHVSEKALMNFPEYQLICGQFQEKHGTDKTKFAEIASYYIVRSQAFLDLISVILKQVKQPLLIIDRIHGNAEAITKKLSDGIVGLPILNSIPILQDLVSGPYDADKLDYLARDAKYCGVPNILDISRLLQKLAVVQLAEDRLPAKIGRGVSGGEQAYHLFGIKSSGAQVLDELSLGRALLFSKVYRHQKVRAHEVMIEAVYRLIAKLTSRNALLATAYRLGDEELLSLTPATLEHCLRAKGITISSPSPVIQGSLTLLLSRLRDRDPFIKVLNVESRYPHDPYENRPTQQLGLKAIRQILTNTVRLNEFKKKLILALQEVINCVDPGLPRRLLYDFLPEAGDLTAEEELEILDAFVMISPQNVTSGSSELSRAYVVSSDEKIAPFESSRFNLDAWASAYDFSGAASGYIFSARELASHVYVAFGRVCYELHQIAIPNSAMQNSKIRQDEIDRVKKVLAGSGFYRTLPIELRPMPLRLTRGDVSGRVAAIASRFAVYQQPHSFDPDHEVDGNIEERIRFWLRQFDNDNLVDVGLELLEKVKFLTRADVVQSAKAFFDHHPEFVGANVCGFGSLKDSAAIVSYFANDLGPAYIKRVISIQEVMQNKFEEPVVFFDDFCASGGQAIDQLSHWFDAEKLQGRNLGEERFSFNVEQQEFLRRRKVAFMFVTAWTTGISRLKDALKNVQLSATTYSHVPESEVPFAFSNCSYDAKPKHVKAFQVRCEEVGRAVLDSQGIPGDKIKDRALGYGNRGMLLVFPYNVPTQTLTCLREEGTVNGIPWFPIFRRRKKT